MRLIEIQLPVFFHLLSSRRHCCLFLPFIFASIIQAAAAKKGWKEAKLWKQIKILIFFTKKRRQFPRFNFRLSRNWFWFFSIILLCKLCLCANTIRIDTHECGIFFPFFCCHYHNKKNPSWRENVFYILKK